MDIFEMKRFADNAVKSQIMSVGVENLNCDEFKIAIVENEKNVTEVKLYSDAARKKMLEALKTEIEYDSRQMKKIADDEEPDKPVEITKPTSTKTEF